MIIYFINWILSPVSFGVVGSLIKAFFFFTILFLFFHISARHFACFFNQILDVLISILLFLGSITFLLCHLHLHLHGICLLLLLRHIGKLLFELLLLQGSNVFLFSHSLWNTAISIWKILDDMSVWAWFYFIVIWCVWLTVLWWRNSLSFVFIIEFNTLYEFQNSIFNIINNGEVTLFIPWWESVMYLIGVDSW